MVNYKIAVLGYSKAKSAFEVTVKKQVIFCFGFELL